MVIFDSAGTQNVPKQNHTSKGDQPKWFVNNVWYKADYMGYESLAEVAVSKILSKSNIKNFVSYEPAQILLEGKKMNGCASKNFKNDNECLITLEKLHRSYFGTGLADKLAHITNTKDKIKYTVDFVTDITGLKDFEKYLTVMLEIDAIFLNEDRHTNNIAVIRNETTKKYRLCPYFDNGLSLLSDLNDYPEKNDVYNQINKVTAKPFSLSFNEQLDEAKILYGSNFQIDFSDFDIEKLFESFDGWYEVEIIKKVKKILFEQKRKYSIYFK